MRQIYENYTEHDQHVWQVLFDMQMAQLPRLASKAFLDGIEKIGFVRDRIPDFDEVNLRLKKITGWQVTVVPGLIPNKDFFELLADKKFPSSTWLRKMEQLDYLEEPDMFHDAFGHLPMLTDPDFCNFVSGFSRIALRFIDNETVVEMVARVYWYTVEFGLIETAQDGLRIYGAGILSSFGESLYSLSDKPGHLPFDVSKIVNTPYIRDRYQDNYYVVNSFRQLYESLPLLEALVERAVMVNV